MILLLPSTTVKIILYCYYRTTQIGAAAVVKRHVSEQSGIEISSEEIQPIAIAKIKLCLSKGIS